MKTWIIWGIGLDKIVVKANSFDEALAESRKINENYNSGQLNS